VASTLHTTSEHGVSSITTADGAHLGCQQSTELTPHADLNGLVRFAERRNVVSARVPSHFKRSLPLAARPLCHSQMCFLNRVRFRDAFTELTSVQHDGVLYFCKFLQGAVHPFAARWPRAARIAQCVLRAC